MYNIILNAIVGLTGASCVMGQVGDGNTAETTNRTTIHQMKEKWCA